MTPFHIAISRSLPCEGPSDLKRDESASRHVFFFGSEIFPKMAQVSTAGANHYAISGALERQPPGTLSLLFPKIPVQHVPRAWRNIPLDLHLEVELRPESDGSVIVFAPMRAGWAAKLLGPKMRKMGVLPDFAAASIQRRRAEGARLRARLVEVPLPQMRGPGPDMGFFLSIRCKA